MEEKLGSIKAEAERLSTAIGLLISAHNLKGDGVVNGSSYEEWLVDCQKRTLGVLTSLLSLYAEDKSGQLKGASDEIMKEAANLIGVLALKATEMRDPALEFMSSMKKSMAGMFSSVTGAIGKAAFPEAEIQNVINMVLAMKDANVSNEKILETVLNLARSHFRSADQD